MAKINDKEINQIIINDRPISSVYLGTTMVWEAVRSCFGNGYWINPKPYINEEAWKNN